MPVTGASNTRGCRFKSCLPHYGLASRAIGQLPGGRPYAGPIGSSVRISGRVIPGRPPSMATLKVKVPNLDTKENAEELAEKLLHCDERISSVTYPMEVERV